MKVNILVTATTLALLSSMAFAESGFLSNYSKLKPVKSSTGDELLFVGPVAYERAVGFQAPTGRCVALANAE